MPDPLRVSAGRVPGRVNRQPAVPVHILEWEEGGESRCTSLLSEESLQTGLPSLIFSRTSPGKPASLSGPQRRH